MRGGLPRIFRFYLPMGEGAPVCTLGRMRGKTDLLQGDYFSTPLIRLEIWLRRAKFQSTFSKEKVRRFAARAVVPPFLLKTILCKGEDI